MFTLIKKLSFLFYLWELMLFLEIDFRNVSKTLFSKDLFVVWYFVCDLTNKACWESESGSSHELAIEVWRTVDRETGNNKVGQRISALWKPEERGGNCGCSTTSLIFQCFTPLLTPDFYQLRLIRFVLYLLKMICLIFYLIMFLFNVLFSILLLDITEKIFLIVYVILGWNNIRSFAFFFVQ